MKITTKLLIIFLLVPVRSYGSWPFFFGGGDKVPIVPKKSTFTIMVDPAGDAHNPGRSIDDTYERSLTMQFAEELQKQLEIPSKVRVVLTRFPGEAVEPLQNASFSNRLAVDLYLSIHFYEKKEGMPHLFIYSLIYDPATDFIQKSSTDLALLPYDQAYKVSLSTTKSYATELYTTCSKISRSYHAQCHSPLALPYKPLIGITAPALGIEIGITKKAQWKTLLPLVVKGIKEIIAS